MKISLLLILLFAVALTSCRTTAPTAESKQRSAPPTQPTEADNWQRTKDCAAQVDAMKDDKPSPNLTHARVAHYSRKYGRCFVRVTDTMSAKARNGQKQNSVMIMDD